LRHDARTRAQWPDKCLEEVAVSIDLPMDIDVLNEGYDLVQEFVEGEQTWLPDGQVQFVKCLYRSCEKRGILSESKRRHFYNDAKPQ
jgi:hypothetical protein